MADVNRGNRPLSPHLTVFSQGWTGLPSILHRITGVGMTLGAALVAWWFLAAATGAAYFQVVDGLLTSWLGQLVLLGLSWALSYHFLNGIRHLWWDTGRGFEMASVKTSAMFVAIGSVVLTAALWLLV